MRFLLPKSIKIQKIAEFCGIEGSCLPFVKDSHSTMNGKGILSDSLLSGALTTGQAYG
jgi:hypothetical protein